MYGPLYISLRRLGEHIITSLLLHSLWTDRSTHTHTCTTTRAGAHQSYACIIPSIVHSDHGRPGEAILEDIQQRYGIAHEVHLEPLVGHRPHCIKENKGTNRGKTGL